MRANRRARRAAADDGQMMLLTAFVLVLGFVALTAMVARVSQLPEETRQSTDRPIYTESAAVAEGVQMMLERIDAQNAVGEDDPGMATYSAHYVQLATDATAHMERLESARGFRLRFADPPIACDNAGGAVVSASYSLNDVNTRIQFTASYALAPAADGSDADTAPTFHACP